MKSFKKRYAASAATECPCASAKPYAACCERLHLGLIHQHYATTAEALMRSRYSAYVLALEDYLLQTWHPATRPNTLDLAHDSSSNLAVKWLGLQVKQFAQYDENHATVEFIARYSVAGKAERLHATSQFVKIKQQWLYVDDKPRPALNI